MYLAGYTMQEIADAVGLSEASIRQTTAEFTELEKVRKNLADFQDNDFEVPIYNLWTFFVCKLYANTINKKGSKSMKPFTVLSDRVRIQT